MSPEADIETETGIELRVLQGPQAGSSLVLATGEYLLGSSDDCTVILAGPRLAERHAEIILGPDSLTMRALEGSVHDATGADLGEEFELAIGEPVELGGIWIAVEEVGSAWSEVPTPPPQRAQPVAGDSGAKAEMSEVAEEGDRDMPAENVSPSDESIPPLAQGINAMANGPTTSPADQAPAASKWRTRLIVAGVAVGVALAGSGLAAGYLNDRGVPHSAGAPQAVRITPDQMPDPVPRALVEYLAASTDRGGLAATRDKEGKCSVSGYVASTSARQSIADALTDIAPACALNVVVEADLVIEANKLLRARAEATHTVLTAQGASGGTLRLAGAAGDVVALNGIQAELRAKLPGIKAIESSVLFPDQLRGRFREKLSAAGLSDRLTVEEKDGGLYMAGRLGAEETARWEAMLVEFSRDYGNVLPIRASVARNIVRLPSGVQAIVGGSIPYLVTERGQRINPGGEIGGQTIVAIHDNEVVMESGRRVRVPR
jgi:type III secretion system YscD/HrpQ family protein